MSTNESANQLTTRNNSELEKYSKAELLEWIFGRLGIGTQAFVEAARGIMIFEKQGHDMSPLRKRLGKTLDHLRLVGEGRLHPEILVKFWGRTELISRIAKLLGQDQQKIVDGEPILLLQYVEGQRTESLHDPLYLVGDEVRQVFAGNHLASLEEQAAYLRAKARKENSRLLPKPEVIEEDGVSLRVDHDEDCVWHRRQAIPRRLLETALKLLRK